MEYSPIVLAKQTMTITRSESNFDRACEEATNLALALFGIGDDGDSNRVEGWERRNCSVMVRFLEYRSIIGYASASHEYDFHAVATKICDEN